METFYIELGGLIHAGRVKRGFSRKALAEIMGVQQMTVYNWEMARCRIHGLEMAKLMKMFKLNISKLPK